MLLKPRKVVVVGDVTDTNNKVVVLKLVVMMITAVGDLDQPGLEVNAFDIALKELNTLKKLADRIHDVRHVQVAGRNFVKHGCEEEKVVVVHERNIDVRISSNGPFNLQCRVQTAKPTAKNDNPRFHNSATSQKILMAPLAFRSLSKSSP